MARRTQATQSPDSTRRWRYLGETPGVLADVRRHDGSTLLAHPGGVYELHTDHHEDGFGHPLLEETTDLAYDPAAIDEPEPAPADAPAGGGDGDDTSESTGDSKPTEEQ